MQEYLKLEDIYVGLTTVRADMESRSAFARGQRQPRYLKVGMGCVMVTLLLIIVLGPLLLFSSNSPFSQDNPVSSVSVEFGVFIATDGDVGTVDTYGGGFHLGTISRYHITDIQAQSALRSTSLNEYKCLQALQTPPLNASVPCNDQPRCKYCGYSYLLGDWNANYQLVQMANTSDMRWDINAQALEALKQLLIAGNSQVSGISSCHLLHRAFLGLFSGRDIQRSSPHMRSTASILRLA